MRQNRWVNRIERLVRHNQDSDSTCDDAEGPGLDSEADMTVKEIFLYIPL